MFNTRQRSGSLQSSISLNNVNRTGDTSPDRQSFSAISPSSSTSSFKFTSHDQARIPGDSLCNQVARRSLTLNSDEQRTAAAAAASSSSTEVQFTPKEQPVTWRSLPKKGQLAILTLARLSEPLAERSLAAYMFYQLRSFDKTLPDSTITSQGGMLTAAFAGAQFLTAVWWGKAADTPWIGRKRVLLVGLFGTALACIGVGFSKTFIQAMCFRALAGALNGNIGVMRTMISEMIQEKKYQSRAFLLMPMCFNIGVIIGPILGGFLADPISSFPRTFGPGSVIGGRDGVRWMTRFPYALPNLFSGIFIVMSALCITLGLDETHQALRNKPDRGRQLGKWLVLTICRRRETYSYSRLFENETELEDTSTALQSKSDVEDALVVPSSSEPQSNATHSTPPAQKPKGKSGIRAILTSNVLLTLLAHHLMALHISSFNALIFLFLPTPRSPHPSRFTFRFTGGLGLTSSHVGLATAIMGVIGFPLQIFVYPPLQARLGTLKGYRLFLPFSAIAYTLLPFLVLLPDKAYLVWPAIAIVLGAQVLSRTFTLTSTVILVNNSSPSAEVLGTVHGVAQSVSSAARMLGPTIGGWGLGVGLKENCVGAVWWAMSILVAMNWSLLWCIYEGDGAGGRA